MPLKRKKTETHPELFRDHSTMVDENVKPNNDLISIPQLSTSEELAQNNLPTHTPPKEESEVNGSEAQKSDSVRQVADPILPEIDIKEESFNEIKALYETELHNLMDKVEGPISKREQFEILFKLLKKEGGMGIKYEFSEDRESQTPQEVLDTKTADCNEFCLLLAVCAKKLEIDITDVTMHIMEMYIQVGESPDHAALITSQEGSYLIDPAYLDNVQVFHPKDPLDVKPIEVRDFYTNVLNGRIIGVKITQKAYTINEMYAVNLMETVGVYEGKLRNATGSEAAELRLKTIGVLEKAHEADPIKLPAQVKLMHHYMVLADDAFAKAEGAGNKQVKQRYYKVAEEYCDKAIELYKKSKAQHVGKKEEKDIKDVLEIKKNAYHAHDILSKIHLLQSDSPQYLSELDEMIGIDPGETTGYLNKISHYYGLAGTAASSSNSELAKKHLQKAKETADLAKKQFGNDPFKLLKLTPMIEKVEKQLEKLNKTEE